MVEHFYALKAMGFDLLFGECRRCVVLVNTVVNPAEIGPQRPLGKTETPAGGKTRHIRMEGGRHGDIQFLGCTQSGKLAFFPEWLFGLDTRFTRVHGPIPRIGPSDPQSAQAAPSAVCFRVAGL